MKTQNSQTFVLLPEETFIRITNTLEKIEKSFAEKEKKKTQPILGEYIPQSAAMKNLIGEKPGFIIEERMANYQAN
jgi:hypothetical protein